MLLLYYFTCTIGTATIISFIFGDRTIQNIAIIFFICLTWIIQQDSWEDVEEEKKDVEKPAEAPKTKSKSKKALAERIEEREVCLDFFEL